MSRISAGTWSPASTFTRSPCTSWDAGIFRYMPSLFTRASGAVIFFRASMAFTAFPSWITPIAVFRKITASMIPVSLNSLKSIEIAAATNKIKIIGSLICSWTISQRVFSFPFFSTFSPWLSNRFPASSWVSPVFVSVWRISQISFSFNVSYIAHLPDVRQRLSANSVYA